MRKINKKPMYPLGEPTNGSPPPPSPPSPIPPAALSPVVNERRRLPVTRTGQIHKFNIAGTKGYIRTGEFEDGSLGEIFINMNKSTDHGPWDCIGLLISMALQRGVPLRDIVRKLAYTHFPPFGPTKNPDIRIARSIIDYVVRWLWIEYGDSEEAAPSDGEGILSNEKGFEKG